MNAPSGFVDAAGSDMHLAPGSAAIDAGDPESYPARDRAGDPRPAGRRAGRRGLRSRIGGGPVPVHAGARSSVKLRMPRAARVDLHHIVAHLPGEKAADDGAGVRD